MAAQPYGNGSYVSRAELTAHLEPMRDDIREIHADVKTVLAFMNGLKAIGKTVVVVATVLGALGGFGYLIAYLILQS